MAAGRLDVASQERLRQLNGMLRELGDGGVLRRAVLKDLRAPALIVAAQQRDAVRNLPKPAPSSFKEHAARNVRVTASLQMRNPRIAVSVRRSDSGPARRPGWDLNKGIWRHPVFGRRNSPWVTQRVPGGWFDRTGANARPRFLIAATAAVDRAAADLARRIDALNM